MLCLTRALSWQSALDERSAWDVFVWYGGLLMMGGVLNETGVTTIFAEWFGSFFPGMSWVVVFLATLPPPHGMPRPPSTRRMIISERDGGEG